MTRSSSRAPQRRRPNLIIGLFVILLLIGLYVFAVSPALAVRGLIQAAEDGDIAALERRVDFPALRDSFKAELDGRMRAEMREELRGEDAGLAALGMMLAPTLMDSAVDTLVTPEAVAFMVESGDAPGDEARAASPEASDGGDIQRSYGYRDLNTFVITLIDPDRPDQPLDLLMRRHGLGWRLSGIDLPDRPAT